MKDLNLDNEFSVIKTLCSDYKEAKVSLLSRAISIDHFADDRTRELYTVLVSMAKRDKELPSYDLLAQDPRISEDAREHILKTDHIYPPAKNKADAEHLYDILEQFRRIRIIRDTYESAMKALSPEDLESSDPEEAITLMEKGLLKVRHYEEDDTLVIGGPDSTAVSAWTEISDRDKPNVIPTGFTGFDEMAGGIPRKGVTTLAATSGGGKSCMANQLAINTYKSGHKIAIFTLEMDTDQLISRLVSNIAEIDYSIIHLGKLNDNPALKRRAAKALEAFDAQGTKDNCVKIYTKRDITISEIAVQVKTFGYDVVIIDYIGLLSREDIDISNDALALGEIVKRSKRFSGSTNAAWVVLAQLNDDGRAKYSRAIEEHSDYMLTWAYGETEEQTHTVEISQLKHRNSPKFKFKLRENFKYQRFENIAGDGTNKAMPGVAKKKQQRHPTASPMPGLSFDGDDDEF